VTGTADSAGVSRHHEILRGADWGGQRAGDPLQTPPDSPAVARQMVPAWARRRQCCDRRIVARLPRESAPGIDGQPHRSLAMPPQPAWGRSRNPKDTGPISMLGSRLAVDAPRETVHPW